MQRALSIFFPVIVAFVVPLFALAAGEERTVAHTVSLTGTVQSAYAQDIELVADTHTQETTGSGDIDVISIEVGDDTALISRSGSIASKDITPGSIVQISGTSNGRGFVHARRVVVTSLAPAAPPPAPAQDTSADTPVPSPVPDALPAEAPASSTDSTSTPPDPFAPPLLPPVVSATSSDATVSEPAVEATTTASTSPSA